MRSNPGHGGELTAIHRLHATKIGPTLGRHELAAIVTALEGRRTRRAQRCQGARAAETRTRREPRPRPFYVGACMTHGVPAVAGGGIGAIGISFNDEPESENGGCLGSGQIARRITLLPGYHWHGTTQREQGKGGRSHVP